MVITLVGFRGSGKSTVGAQLAARLNCRFVDADMEIQSRAGLTIAEIFQQHGEPWFRNLECQVLAELLCQHELVIAAGGGAVMNDNTRQTMRAAGPVVWLQASNDALLERIQSDIQSQHTRPRLTASTDLADEIRTLLARREPLYADIATLTVSTTGQTVTAIVDDILSHLATTGEFRW